MLDYIIVGFGLSGASLAHYLEDSSNTFVVFDDESQRASLVAGGLYNPVVLKKFTLAWNAEDQLEKARGFYTALENKLGVCFQQSVSIHRKFNSAAEQNNWFSAMDKPGLSRFLDPELVDSHNQVPSDHRFGKVLHTGILDTSMLLKTYSDYLSEKDQLLKDRFQYDDLQITADVVRYKNVQAKQIVFCEGFGMKKNPFFDYLPLQGNKGEYIIIKAPDLKLTEVIKAGVFIIPLKDDLYKVGATYDRDFEDQEPSNEAKIQLLKKLDTCIDCDYTLVDQVAGVRPTVPDRKPLVGRHPIHQNLYCCNGFGSRGILIAPTVAQQLVRFIEEDEPLPREIDVRRFS